MFAYGKSYALKHLPNPPCRTRQYTALYNSLPYHSDHSDQNLARCTLYCSASCCSDDVNSVPSARNLAYYWPSGSSGHMYVYSSYSAISLRLKFPIRAVRCLYIDSWSSGGWRSIVHRRPFLEMVSVPCNQ